MTSAVAPSATHPPGARLGAPPEARLRWWRLCALAAGAVPALLFAPVPLWSAAWFCLVPWILVVQSSPTSREAMLRSWLGAFAFLVAAHHWLLPVTGVLLLPAAAVLSLLWLPWGVSTWWFLRRPLTLPRLGAAATVTASAWCLTEVVRSWEHLGGPWALLGATQSGSPPMLASAEVGGVWLTGFLVVDANTALAAAASTSSAPVRAAALALAVVCAAAGPLLSLVREEPPVQGHMRVAVVQPGFSGDAEERFGAGEAMTREIRDRPDLVVWAESSVGFDLAQRNDLLVRLQALASDTGAPILVNVDARRGRGGIYKSSVVVTPAGTGGTYDKMRLVPFGEYVPLPALFGWLRSVTDAADEDRRRGAEPSIIEVADSRVGPLVCFESAFPDMSRTLVREGADLLLVQSATTTFQRSWAPGQHAALASLRAAETGRAVVHASLAGETAVVDPTGRRIGRLGTDESGVVAVDVPLATGHTAFVRTGAWVPVVSIVTLALAAAVAVTSTTRAGPRSAPRAAVRRSRPHQAQKEAR